MSMIFVSFGITYEHCVNCIIWSLNKGRFRCHVWNFLLCLCLVILFSNNIVCEFKGLICDVSLDTLALSGHYLFYVNLIIFKPAEIISDKVQWVTILTTDQDNSFLIAMTGECTCLFMTTTATSICHQEKSILTSLIPFNLVFAECVSATAEAWRVFTVYCFIWFCFVFIYGLGRRWWSWKRSHRFHSDNCLYWPISICLSRLETNQRC